MLILGIVAFNDMKYHHTTTVINIFDEIYTQTNSSYLNKNIFRNLNDVIVYKKKVYDSDMNDTGKLNPQVVYKEEAFSNIYSNVKIDFDLHSKNQGFIIWFQRKLPNSDFLWYTIKYNSKNKLLEKEVNILNNNGRNIADTDKEVRPYLKSQEIKVQELNDDYNKIINNLVLKDWVSIYESKFSSTNYGDVTVKTQWQDW